MSKQRIRDSIERTPPQFDVGQPVWLSTKNIKIQRKNAKLDNRRLGPFKVAEKTGPLTYRLSLPTWMKIHDNIHVDRLSPWKGNEVNGMEPPPPEPEVIDGEEHWEVDQIIDSRIHG